MGPTHTSTPPRSRSDMAAKPLIYNSVNKARFVGMATENIEFALDS